MLRDGYHDVANDKLAVVVTQLEMRARADTRPVPAPSGVTLRRVETPSLEWYRSIFSRIGADWLWVSRTVMSDADLSAIIHDKNIHIWTLSKDGADEALLELDFRTPGECELMFFGLTSALIGTGAGRFLMNTAIETAWAAGISRFHLHTCTGDSQQAMQFYVRSGFVPIKRKIEIFDDPRKSNGWNPSLAPHLPVL
ncbi:GNAT family N-acetyltransferase [Pseudosulfitobacter sp. SM2401]|uniref:GNAT family N-acetyltransferase n=1 Tax=Pseudosulfitobacter sp. SM2401 TaxID=3350098 RepID=UPI0036F22242